MTGLLVRQYAIYVMAGLGVYDPDTGVNHFEMALGNASNPTLCHTWTPHLSAGAITDESVYTGVLGDPSVQH